MNTRLYQTTNLVKEVLEENKRARNSDTYFIFTSYIQGRTT